MKRIIELPDKMYNRIKSDNGHGYCSLRDGDERIVVEAILHSTPYEEPVIRDCGEENE